MKEILLILILLFMISLVFAESEIKTKSPWLGKDKIMHFTGSTILTVWNYGVYHDCFSNPKPESMVFAISITSLMGIGKELSDSKSNGSGWSWPDLIYDLAGITFGAIAINNLNVP